MLIRIHIGIKDCNISVKRYIGTKDLYLLFKHKSHYIQNFSCLSVKNISTLYHRNNQNETETFRYYF